MSRFRKPSARRLLWSIIAVALSCCVLTGTVMFIYQLTLPSDTPTPTGDYVRLSF